MPVKRTPLDLKLKRQKVKQLIHSFIKQAHDHYYDRYQLKHLNEEFIQELTELDNNPAAINKELKRLSWEKLDQFDNIIVSNMTHAGMTIPVITRDDQIDKIMMGIEDPVIRRVLLNAWRYGDEITGRAICDYLDEMSEIRFDLESKEAEGEITRDNGKIIYHLPESFKNINKTDELLNASLILGHETHCDGLSGNNKEETRNAIFADIEMTRKIVNGHDNNALKKNPAMQLLLKLSKNWDKENLSNFIDSFFDSTNDYYRFIQNKQKYQVNVNIWLYAFKDGKPFNYQGHVTFDQSTPVSVQQVAKVLENESISKAIEPKLFADCMGQLQKIAQEGGAQPGSYFISKIKSEEISFMVHVSSIQGPINLISDDSKLFVPPSKKNSRVIIDNDFNNDRELEKKLPQYLNIENSRSNTPFEQLDGYYKTMPPVENFMPSERKDTWNWDDLWKSASPWVHGALDVVGLIPLFGEVADGANTAIYAAEGDYVSSAISAAAMIPFAGWFATGAKVAYKGGKALTKLMIKEAAEEATEKIIKETGKKITRGVAEEVTEKVSKEVYEKLALQNAKYIVKSSKVTEKAARETTQILGKNIFEEVVDEGGNRVYRVIKSTPNNLKGDFGEVMTDFAMETKGYVKVGGQKGAGKGLKINPKSQGIDGVYQKPASGKYIVGESKFGISQLSTLPDGTKQMSKKWIEDRLEQAVGRRKMMQILKEGYDKVIFKIDELGNVTEIILQ